MNNAKYFKKARFELPETSSGQQKRASEKALGLNGGNNAFRFELLVRIYTNNLSLYSKFKQLEQYIQVL